MNYLLHIDTSADTGIVAVCSDGLLLDARANEETRNHAGTINLMIEEVLAGVEITFEQLSGIVVCAGPGSYTGLRIGMATAKGLCYALDKPLILDNKLTLLAYQAYLKYEKACPQYISLLLARDKEYFISIYDNDFICIQPPRHILEDQLKILIEKKEKTFITSDAPADVINSLGISDLRTETSIKTDLTAWAFYALKQYNCNNIVNLSAAEPFYLKQVYTHK